MASGFSLVSLRIPFCRVMYCCMRGSVGFGGDWVWQPRHTASKEGTCATLESKLNAKRCKECEAVKALKQLFLWFAFRSSSEAGSKRRRGGEGWLDDVTHKFAFQLRKVMSCLGKCSVTLHPPCTYLKEFRDLDTSPYSPSMFLRPRTNLTRTKKAGSLQLPVSKSNDSKLQLPFPSREQEK